MDMKSAYKKSLQMIKERNINNIKDYTILAKEEKFIEVLLAWDIFLEKILIACLMGMGDSPHA